MQRFGLFNFLKNIFYYGVSIKSSSVRIKYKRIGRNFPNIF